VSQQSNSIARWITIAPNTPIWIDGTMRARKFDSSAKLHNGTSGEVASLRKITATITEWPPKWFLKLSEADRPLRCMVLFWLFFVLVLVLVLDRARNCIIPSRSTRCSGRNLVMEVMDRITEIRSMIRELGNGGLCAVRQGALMPCTRGVRLRLRAPSATAD